MSTAGLVSLGVVVLQGCAVYAAYRYYVSTSDVQMIITIAICERPLARSPVTVDYA